MKFRKSLLSPKNNKNKKEQHINIINLKRSEICMFYGFLCFT